MELVNITEIHKNNGGEVRHLPNKFTSLISPTSDEVKTVKGRYGGGTFVSPRVAALYEEWVSCGVNRSFRSLMDKEKAALDTIEQILNISLERQFKVCGFRVDGYDIKGNVAYEIDEGHHKTTVNYAKDARRQAKIQAEIGCEFVRIKV